ncbi:MAG: NUDIX hydrolase [Candidatus Sungbacteria bacterium]|nr:NUDIX hydrolase [Candidatus Sungbacteria bacterium]
MVEYKKSSAVLVFNDKGELALQLRAANDDSFPSHWDFSAGGGIDVGEDPKDSAKRELREELGVDATVEFIAEEHYKYPAWKPSVSREVDLFIYKAHHNGPFNLDPAEIAKVQFLKLTIIKEMIESDAKFHPEFVLSWNKGIISRAANN